MNRPVLVIGYGNELRSDDGVGPRIAREIAAREGDRVRAIAVHQLVPELAEPLSEARLAVFVDAACNPGDAVKVRRLAAEAAVPSLGHTGDPRILLAMTQGLYGRCPEAWLVTVPAVNLDFGEELSPLTIRASAEAMLKVTRLAARLGRARGSRPPQAGG